MYTSAANMPTPASRRSGGVYGVDWYRVSNRAVRDCSTKASADAARLPTGLRAEVQRRTVPLHARVAAFLANAMFTDRVDQRNRFKFQ